MADKIRVLIVDDLPETRENVRKLLQFEADIEVIGQASNGEQAIEMAKSKRPDIVLMDINMPGVDGIGASQTITQAIPGVQTIIMSVQSESDYLRRAMLAGARDFLMKPFSGDEVGAAIRRVYESRPAVQTAPAGAPADAAGAGAAAAPATKLGHIITVFSPKGGTGCTTVAVNLAAALADAGHRTVLVDGSLQFGDVAFMLNLKPATTIVDVVDRIEELDADLISSVTLNHKDVFDVMLAPPRPEMAEYITAETMLQTLAQMRHAFEFIVVDTSSHLTDVSLSVLDQSQRIVLLLQQSLPSIKNARLFLDLTHELDYDQNKVKLVINQTVRRGVTVERIAATVKRPIVATIPEDEAAVERSISDGTPLVLGRDARRAIGTALKELALLLRDDLLDNDEPRDDGDDDEGPSRLSRLFGR